MGRSSAADLVVAMPAYNEAAGIGGFLQEFDAALQAWDGHVSFVVVDDHSTDDTSAVLEDASRSLSAALHVFNNAENVGHGPSTVRALEEALRLRPAWIVQMDGDGQFIPAEVVDLLRWAADYDIVQGVRRSREDPWFRRVLTRAVRLYVRLAFDARNPDPNCPLRIYRHDALEGLLRRLPAEPIVPTIYLSVLAARQRLAVRFVQVTHRSRLGGDAQGSTWGGHSRRVLVPRRLTVFVWRALLESIRFRRHLGRH